MDRIINLYLSKQARLKQHSLQQKTLNIRHLHISHNQYTLFIP